MRSDEPDLLLPDTDIHLWSRGVLTTQSDSAGLIVVSIEVEAVDSFDVEVEAPLGAAIGLWQPATGRVHPLPPDWLPATTTSLVESAPVVVSYDAAAQAPWGVACDEVIGEVALRGGVSEEHKSVRLWLSTAPTGRARTVRLAFATRPRPLAETVDGLAAWLREVNAIDALPVPAAATEPVYSTWYTYTQDVNDANVRAEGRLAAELGCGSLFIDDGWQVGGHGRGYAGCGDWLPDLGKFPDLAGTVRDLRENGLATVAWIAPLLLGEHSERAGELGRFAPSYVEMQQCSVLDPRFAEVRSFVASTCTRLVADYGLAGLKIDFLDQAMLYSNTASQGDIADVGEAMREMLRDIRAALARTGLTDPIIEFRMPYVSPALIEFGNCLRVSDCPADVVANRRGSIDLRMFVHGAAVHSDPLMWAPDGGAPAAAQQFLGTFFAVPQVSMPLAGLDDGQRAAVAHHLTLWREWRDVALFAPLRVAGAEVGYARVSAQLDGRAVVALYRPEVVDLAEITATEVLLLNATSSSSCVLRNPGGVWDVAEVSDPAGASQRSAGLADGLVELAVPPFGTAVLRS